MPPKKPSQASKSNSVAIGEEDDVLQAVVLADSFNNRFKPLTVYKPRCLLPICNAPLLDWTFESLALAGVREVFVVCRSHSELVKAAIKKSRWSQPGSGMKIVPIVTTKQTFSVGDALRDIYTHGVITTDFVLVSGDLVSNIRIDEVVRVHKERRKKNKDAIMTIVAKECGANHRTRSKGEYAVFVLDPKTSECLHYQHALGHPPTKIASIPREILTKCPEIEIRNDLIDCSIDVCSVEVPSLFQDNFDYQDIRRDFVHGVLTSDLLMKNIHCYIAKEGYAARVRDTRIYDAVSKDILARWTFPLVPDTNHPQGHVYGHLRGDKYIAKDNSVFLARTCNVGPKSLLGSSTHVSDNVEIISSVIGLRCTIGEASVVRGSYLFDDVVVEANCVIERSIIGEGVTIKEGSTIPKGCLIGDHVVLGPGARLVPFERVSKRRQKTQLSDEDVDSELEEVERKQAPQNISLGKDSNAIVWPRRLPEEDEDPDSVENATNMRFMRIADDACGLDLSDGDSVTSSEEESESSSSDEIEELSLRKGLPLLSSVASLPRSTTSKLGGKDMELPESLLAESEFRTEVRLSLQRAFSEGHKVEDAAVELKTLRMASNVPLRLVREAVVAAIVEHIQIVEGQGVSVAQRQEISRVVGRWGELINKIGGVDPVETIAILQNHCASSDRLPLFGQILVALYQDDIVEEDHIRKWHDRPESKAESFQPSVKTDNLRKCWAIGGRMIEQFDEQDSESE